MHAGLLARAEGFVGNASAREGASLREGRTDQPVMSTHSSTERGLGSKQTRPTGAGRAIWRPYHWMVAFLVAAHAAHAATLRPGSASDPLRAFCDSDDMLVHRGVRDSEVREWNEMAVTGISRLLNVWATGSSYSSSSRVYMVGDSMMGNVYQAIWCAAARAGCSVKQGTALEVLTSGGLREYSPDQLLYRDKVSRNPVTEAIVQRHRVSCPHLGLAVKLIWVKYWWFDEPDMVGNLNIRRETLLNLTKYADFMYANIGHDVSQPGNSWKIPGIVASIAEAAEQAQARRVKKAGERLATRSFVLERPPKHFVGFGNGTGDHAPEGQIKDEELREMAKECTCEQPHHSKSFVAAGNASTRAAVSTLNAELPLGQHLLGLIGSYKKVFVHKPRCLLHHGGGDCTHYLHHPGIWFPVMDEMYTAALGNQSFGELKAHHGLR